MSAADIRTAGHQVANRDERLVANPLPVVLPDARVQPPGGRGGCRQLELAGPAKALRQRVGEGEVRGVLPALPRGGGHRRRLGAQLDALGAGEQPVDERRRFAAGVRVGEDHPASRAGADPDGAAPARHTGRRPREPAGANHDRDRRTSRSSSRRSMTTRLRRPARRRASSSGRAWPPPSPRATHRRPRRPPSCGRGRCLRPSSALRASSAAGLDPSPAGRAACPRHPAPTARPPG